MKLKEGNEAPDFVTEDIYGNEVKLSNYRGNKIILSFYRNVSSPFCNRRVHQIISHSLKFQKCGVQLIFLFESSEDKLSSSIFHQGISTWPLISDPEKNIYRKYGVESSKVKMMRTMVTSSISKAKKYTRNFNLPEDKDASMNLIPADFFIDENLRIAKAHYGKHLDDHVPMKEIKTFVEILNC